MTDSPTNEGDSSLRQMVIEPGQSGQRLDRFLAAQLAELSRARIQELIREGHVRRNGALTRSSRCLEAGDRIEIELVPRPSLAARPEALPLQVLYQDEDIVVVNKPAGMVVHAGAGNASGTLVNALLHHFGELSRAGGPLRPGLVHRMDKGTSGVLVVARTDRAHRELARQFAGRTVRKTYLALVHGSFRQDSGTITLPVARDARRRTRMTARSRFGRSAKTDWRVRFRVGGFTLIEASPHTGRTHQIRVHLSAIGHPVVGDTLYGAPRQLQVGRRRLAPVGRIFLHAARLGFSHPGSGAAVEFRAPLAPELAEFLRGLVESAGGDLHAIDAVEKEFL